MTLLENLERLSRGHVSGCSGYNALGPQRKARRQVERGVGRDAGQGNEKEEKIEKEEKRVGRTRGGEGKEDMGKTKERRAEKNKGWWKDWHLSPLWSYPISVAVPSCGLAATHRLELPLRSSRLNFCIFPHAQLVCAEGPCR